MQEVRVELGERELFDFNRYRFVGPERFVIQGTRRKGERS